MKKLTMSAIFAALIMFSACAQKLDAAKVPAAVKTAFAQKFPGTTATWGKENSKEYEAEFDLKGKEASANFLSNGTWVETELEIAIAELPQPAHAAVMKKYPGAVIKKVFKIENAKGATTYEAEVTTGSKKKEVVLKADGTVI